MAVESIKIQAFKSLYSVTLEPGQLRVLVGANNAGKTNIVEALEFLGDVHRFGLEIAVRRGGGFTNIAFRRMRRTRIPIAFEVTAVVPVVAGFRFVYGGRGPYPQRMPSTRNATRVRVRHRFEVIAESEAIRADFSIKSEIVELALADDSEQRALFDVSAVFFRLTRTGNTQKIWIKRPSSMKNREWELLVGPLGDKQFQKTLREFKPPETDLVLARVPWIGAYTALAETLSGIRLFQLSPVECREPGVPTPNADLERHGRNLPALLDFMQRNHPDSWQAVLRSMRRVVPGLEDVRVTFNPDRSLALLFDESGVGTSWTAQEVSDGTIQGLALFSVLNDPRATLVMIEEPENSVHPWIIRNFVEACREASDRQILLTTHSPVLIDYLRPDEIGLVWRRKGRTQLEPLEAVDADARRIWESGEVGLFDLLDSGWLDQAVPEGEE